MKNIILLISVIVIFGNTGSYAQTDQSRITDFPRWHSLQYEKISWHNSSILCLSGDSYIVDMAGYGFLGFDCRFPIVDNNGDMCSCCYHRDTCPRGIQK